MTIDKERKRKRKAQAYHKKYYEEHKDVSRRSKLKLNYGLTPEDYEAMFVEQGGRCAICRKHSDDLDYPLAVDHNHVTGLVRGLICANCNHVLGRCGDNVSILLAAVDYLNRGGYAYQTDGRAAIAIQRCVGSVGGTDGTPAHFRGTGSDGEGASEDSVPVDPDVE